MCRHLFPIKGCFEATDYALAPNITKWEVKRLSFFVDNFALMTRQGFGVVSGSVRLFIARLRHVVREGD